MSDEISSILPILLLLIIIAIPIILIIVFGKTIKEKIASLFNMLKPECTELKAGQDFVQEECTKLKGPGYYCDVTKCKPLKTGWRNMFRRRPKNCCW